MGDRASRASAGSGRQATPDKPVGHAKRSAPPRHLNPTLGPVVCDWVEEYLVNGPGDIQGTTIVIDDEFRKFIWQAYELFPKGHPEAGRRVYRRAFLSRPKGRAKSALAGMLACAELLGPVRSDGWDAKGNPVGIPVTAPEILCVATEATQAGNTFDNCVYMLQNGPAFDEYPGLDIGLSRIYYADGGGIEPITAAARSKDGGKSTFIVADEVHLWTEERLKRLHATLTRNITKRKIGNGWMFETSTMYAPGEDSVAEGTHRTSRSNPSVLFNHREAPKDTDISDDESLRKGLTYVYGSAAGWTNIEGIIQDEFRNPQKRESDNRRYWLNQPVTIEQRFLSPEQWDPLAAPDRFDTDADPERKTFGGAPIHPIPDGSRVVLAFDGSKVNDNVALVVCLIDKAPHLDVVACWERPDDQDEWEEVDILAVEETIRQACERWDVVEIAADTARWARSLQVLADEGLPAVKFPQTSARMTPATKRLRDFVTSRVLTHSGDARLRRHLLNAIVVDDYRGFRLAKNYLENDRKIDLAVASVMGLDRAASLPEEAIEYANVAFASDLAPSPDATPHPGPQPPRVITQAEQTIRRDLPEYWILRDQGLSDPEIAVAMAHDTPTEAP